LHTYLSRASGATSLASAALVSAFLAKELVDSLA
jgi:hypothetical protein